MFQEPPYLCAFCLKAVPPPNRDIPTKRQSSSSISTISSEPGQKRSGQTYYGSRSETDLSDPEPNVVPTPSKCQIKRHCDNCLYIKGRCCVTFEWFSGY